MSKVNWYSVYMATARDHQKNAADLHAESLRLMESGHDLLAAFYQDDSANQYKLADEYRTKAYEAKRAQKFSVAMAGDVPIILQGPAGGEIAKSQFALLPLRKCWQWAAWDKNGNILMVVETPFVLRDVCDTVYGSLWAIRGIASHYVMPTRSGKGL